MSQQNFCRDKNKNKFVAAPANDGLDGAWGGVQSLEVLKRGGLHLVVTDVVPVGGWCGQKRALVLPLKSNMAALMHRDT